LTPIKVEAAGACKRLAWRHAMQRAIGRAYLRVRGAHPRRPKSDHSLLIEIGCDALLAFAGMAVLAGFALVAWAMLDGLQLTKVVLGLALLALGPLLLLVWERVAWEPFVERLSELS
jgi:hypothetical protein